MSDEKQSPVENLEKVKAEWLDDTAILETVRKNLITPFFESREILQSLMTFESHGVKPDKILEVARDLFWTRKGDDLRLTPTRAKQVLRVLESIVKLGNQWPLTGWFLDALHHQISFIKDELAEFSSPILQKDISIAEREEQFRGRGNSARIGLLILERLFRRTHPDSWRQELWLFVDMAKHGPRIARSCLPEGSATKKTVTHPSLLRSLQTARKKIGPNRVAQDDVVCQAAWNLYGITFPERPTKHRKPRQVQSRYSRGGRKVVRPKSAKGNRGHDRQSPSQKRNRGRSLRKRAK